jgi:hypothetical protein
VEQALQARGVLGHSKRPFAGATLFPGAGMRALRRFRVPRSHRRLRAVRCGRRDAVLDHGEARRHGHPVHAISRGMATLFQDGLGKVLLGETSFDEILRVAV